MKPFIHDDFMLTNEASRVLFHQYAKDMPIYDYHCHLSPKEIAENRRFSNITEIWLHGDHYKWRAMRSLGVEEELITGKASDYEKFQAWARSVPYTIGNPLYHWTHLELKRYFETDLLLNEETSEEIWNHCSAMIQTKDFRTQGIIAQSGVKVICTTDDPIDTLEFHQRIKEQSSMETKVLPAFRPDKAVEIIRPDFQEYINKLSDVSETDIISYENLLKALEKRIHYFHREGCRISDHGIETLPYTPCTLEEASAIFEKGVSGQSISKQEEEMYKTYTLLFLGRMYSSLGWVMQFHVGALRNNNHRMFNLLGPDTGYDSIHDFDLSRNLNGFLNELDKRDELPKTILYSLNPNHNYTIATAIGNFQSSETKGKLQLGSGWWYNDQKIGMVKQMTDLASIGILSTFIGMLTDSRSFLSFTRHEYFRRILCDLLGGWVEAGEAPRDYHLLGKIVQDICYTNASNYFEIE
ncbi:glucuronate isomerase [Evansella tamaricis]|uniref:Uronate isomerase n=1 Tax=Evansella tamaricis TaxID=2069301 RepID=A0ABS6JD96_9BACI|nr:glucuronate isomerase [Evansella tamaricis]MBU9711621.1 glucuronate isomerase [Evansella tamaricis]